MAIDFEFNNVYQLHKKDADLYRQLINHSPSAYIICHKNKILYINKACLEMFGYKSQDELDNDAIFNSILKNATQYFAKNSILPDQNTFVSDFETRSKNSTISVEIKLIHIPDSYYQALVIKQIKSNSGIEFDHFSDSAIFNSTATSPLATVNLNEPKKVYFRTNPHGLVINIENSILDILGYKRSEIIGKPLHSLFVDQNNFSALLHLLESNKNTIHEIQLQLRCATESIIWAAINLDAVFSSDSYLIGMEGFITASPLSQEVVPNSTENNDSFRKIFERSASGIALVDVNGYLKITNTAVQEMLGYSADELSKMIFTDFTHPDDVNKNWQLQQELTTGKRDYYKMEKRCFRKNGDMFWGSVNVSAIRNENGRVVSIIGVLEDITDRKNIEAKLEQSTAQFKAIFNSISDVAVFVDTNRNIAMTNPAITKQFGYKQDELQGRSAKVIYADSADYNTLGTSRFNVDATINSQLYEMTYRRKDGSCFIGETQGTKVEDDQGNVIGFIAIVRNISERKKTEERLRLSQKIFEDTAKAILITDSKTNIIDVNDAFCETTGYTRDELIGKTPRVLKSGWHDESFYNKLWDSLNKSGYWKGEIWDQKKNGDIFPTWSTISVVKDERGQSINYVAILSDISVIKQSEKRLEYLAHYDQLTKLPNRMLFNDRLNVAIARAERHKEKIAVMYVDLDGFKQVNDTLGHNAGDELLKNVAIQLKQCIRDEDTIARLGGDEFAIIVNELETMDFLHILAKRITDVLSISLKFEGREISVTGSIGVATYPANGTDEETLLRHADQAMYYAKQQGRNSYQFFDPTIKADILKRIHLGADLRSAIKNDEFFMLFQPKYNLKIGKVVGVEALVRWQHPEHGLILPVNFIPFAEDSNLIIEIGEKIIELVCQHVETWKINGQHTVPVAINISARQFRNNLFIEYIQTILEKTNVPAASLELEVTESLLMDDIENTISILQTLKDMGFKISIDDFGTGYSSLSYLKKLPVDTLKIDQSFVKDISENNDDREIVSAILSMANSLNLHVIAEGVENREQLGFLKDNHCYEVQGRYFANPVSFDQLFYTIDSIENRHRDSS